MEEPTVTRQRLSRYTSKQIKEYIKHWRKSGLSKNAFCESNNINYYTFVGWSVPKKKKKAAPAPINSFIPVKVRENAALPFAPQSRQIKGVTSLLKKSTLESIFYYIVEVLTDSLLKKRIFAY